MRLQSLPRKNGAVRQIDVRLYRLKRRNERVSQIEVILQYTETNYSKEV